MKKKIIVFGATGKVGCYTALHLKEMGYEVHATGKRADDNGFFADYGIPYHSVDILDPASMSGLPQSDLYGVVHMAALLPATMQGYHPRRYVESNICGTLNVLDYAVAAGMRRLVYPKSWADITYLCGSLRPIPADAPVRFPLNDDHSMYAITKNAACDMIRHYAARYGFDYTILRFPNIFCYHPNPTYYVDGVKRWTGQRAIIEQAKRGEPIELWGDPECARDVFYVKDCTQIIEKAFSVQRGSGLYNVGTGQVVTRREQIQGIIDLWSPREHPSTIVVNRDKPDSPCYLLDISTTVRDLGFRPQYDYRSYLKDLKQEMERNRFEKLWGREEDYTKGL